MQELSLTKLYCLSINVQRDTKIQLEQFYTVVVVCFCSKILKQKERSEKMKEFGWLRDSTRNGRVNFNLAQYHSFAEIIHYMNSLAVNYPEIVQVMPIGTTHEGRQIPLMKVFLSSFSFHLF